MLLLSFLARRSLSVKSLFSLLASQTVKRQRVQLAEVRLDPVVRVVAAALDQVEVVAEVVDATPVGLVATVV